MQAVTLTNTTTVAYLGPPGTFSQLAVLNHFGQNCEAVPCASIDEVFRAIESGSVEAGVVPVENSTEGVVNNTQDCLVDSKAVIVGEEIVPIVHNLLASEGTRPEDISVIASHKQSLAQCRNWLLENYPNAEQLECVSNAEAAIRASSEKGVAAIAGELAAAVYHLQVLESGIQDQQHNRTRFLVLAKDRVDASGNDKTSILVYTENKPGALFRVLEPFEQLAVSLTKIDSRPSKKEAWEYVFFIDFEGHMNDERIKTLFKRLHSCTEEIKILGSYPAYNKKLVG